MAQQLVALDLGDKRARMVVLDASFRNAKLVSLQTLAAETGEEEESVLERVSAAAPAHIDSAITGIDATNASTRLLAFPFADMRKVEAALDFELESQVPYDLDDMALSWAIAGRGAGRTEVLAALTPRDGLLAQIGRLRQHGLEPRAMVLPAAALAELVPGEVDEPLAVLSVGETQSHLAILRAGGLRFARTLRAGGAHVDRALARRYGIDIQQAKEAKEEEARLLDPAEAANDESRELSNAVEEGVGSLVRALGATLRALPPDDMPRRVLLTGGSSRLPGLAEFLHRRLGIPVELLDLRTSLAAVECEVESIGPEYADALALALTLLRRGRSAPLNLRRGNLAYQGDLQMYRGEMVRVAVGLAIVLLLFVVTSIVRYSLISGEEERLDQAFCSSTKKIIGREICNPTAAIASLQQTPDIGEGLQLPSYSATSIYEMLSRLIDTDLDVTFDDLEIRVTNRREDPDRINAKGEAADFETTERIVGQLQQHPCIQEAEVSKQRRTRNNESVEFNLTAKVRCPSGVEPAMAASKIAKAAGVDKEERSAADEGDEEAAEKEMP